MVGHKAISQQPIALNVLQSLAKDALERRVVAVLLNPDDRGGFGFAADGSG
jgi:hypothetical protein